MLVGKCMCPCGGGQSCIVDRRELNDWVNEVNEDDLLREFSLIVFSLSILYYINI